MNQINVVVLGDPAEPTLKLLDRIGNEVKLTVAKTADGLGESLTDARVLFNWSGPKAEIRNVLERAPKLEWIHARYAGLDASFFRN